MFAAHLQPGQKAKVRLGTSFIKEGCLKQEQLKQKTGVKHRDT